MSPTLVETLNISQHKQNLQFYSLIPKYENQLSRTVI